ncbi:MAG: flagellar export chaperone FliS [Nocardioidaceae bacterium]|mgnify:CR=1 FL=1
MTPPNTAARAAYLDASVATASPAKLLVMLCDRLVRDISTAVEAQKTDDHPAAHPHLLHAQEIVLELRASLRPDLWAGAANLDAIYEFLYSRLVHANVHRDVDASGECLGLATRIADTWREAALQSVAAS